ncbi:DegT/DnrJ/EryC1/StrS family aminotransferase [Zooshikella marina]|uniref:DegT/DnrJ/EryC1/StrS family aminotransferase n=1 Tax=Zooshikella ganghwensis TaxID=202772 RepID=UPI001BAF20B3|nr:DegT/DnrJ/EryC1/StrS family aminotransferase [Zooshikella ganghwensis]MBU2704616.1 DegT/DnrJ/EryC1/StrS family aminotransferase [Zooshikella ganghwensis]
MSTIKLIKPYINYEEISADLKKIFLSGQLTKGENVNFFKKSLSDYTGAKFTHLTTSATTALSISLKALNIKEGDHIAVADFSFPATVNVIEDIGAIPVFIDVCIETYNMSVSHLRKSLNEYDIKAVIFVDTFGNPSGLDKIVSICKEYSVKLIEDAACGIGSSLNNQKIGNIADITCFSFHPRKLLTTGEGGAIQTNCEELDKWFEIKLNHGAVSMIEDIPEFVDFGFNFRMSEIQALLGWKQLLKLDEIIKERNYIHKNLTEKIPLKSQKILDNVLHNKQSLVYTVESKVIRDNLIKFLKEKQIESTIGTYCLSGTKYYKEKYNAKCENSTYLQAHTITLPCYKAIDIDLVSSEINSFFK